MFNILPTNKRVSMSDVLLDIEYNPQNIDLAFDDKVLTEVIGVLPYWFSMCGFCTSLDEVAQTMDAQYQCGSGFSHSSFKGNINEDGSYVSYWEDGEEIMKPWAKVRFKKMPIHNAVIGSIVVPLPKVEAYMFDVIMWCYESSIIAIQDPFGYMIARFD